jgi:hypothetical protein
LVYFLMPALKKGWRGVVEFFRHTLGSASLSSASFFLIVLP